MKIPYYHVDAFSGSIFRGNPAAVCLLARWLPETTLEGIAAENNLSETAFLVAQQDDFELRWFTPTVEVDLCGHATLAAAFVLFTERGFSTASIRFHTRSGILTVARDGDVCTLNFPSRPAVSAAAPENLIRGLGRQPEAVFRARDYLAVFGCAEEVRALTPNFALLKSLNCLGIIATAPGGDCDFISRYFAPAAGIDEDPVTGSAHCTLIPYWAQRLGKTSLRAQQASTRGGELICRDAGERVLIGGKAKVYLRGEIELPE